MARSTSRMGRFRFLALGLAMFVGAIANARAADVLCDPSFENCRTRLLDLIRNERVGIDVAFWFMEDARYTNELIKKWQEGVPVRVIDKRFAITGLGPGTTCFWRIVSRTMANLTAAGPIQSFTTAGTPPPPPPTGTGGQGDVVLYAARAGDIQGGWRTAPDATAAGGVRLGIPDAGAPKLSPGLANPADYFELTFQADAARPYRLWIRGKADNNYWANDSARSTCSSRTA